MRALPAECAQIYVGGRERDAPSASSVREDTTGSVGARTGGNLSDSTLPSRVGPRHGAAGSATREDNGPASCPMVCFKENFAPALRQRRALSL